MMATCIDSRRAWATSMSTGAGRNAHTSRARPTRARAISRPRRTQARRRRRAARRARARAASSVAGGAGTLRRTSVMGSLPGLEDLDEVEAVEHAPDQQRADQRGAEGDGDGEGVAPP